MNYWIELLQIIIITYVLSDLSKFIGDLLSGVLIIFKNKFKALIFNLFLYLLSCEKCFSFWTTLIITGNLFTSALVSIIINIIKTIEYKYKKTEL